MTELRNIGIKLTLDASEYINGMNRAARATRRLAKAYRSLPRKARMIARLAQTHGIDNRTLTSTKPTRKQGPRVF